MLFCAFHKFINYDKHKPGSNHVSSFAMVNGMTSGFTIVIDHTSVKRAAKYELFIWYIYRLKSTNIFAKMTSYAFWNHLSSPPINSQYGTNEYR